LITGANSGRSEAQAGWIGPKIGSCSALVPHLSNVLHFITTIINYCYTTQLVTVQVNLCRVSRGSNNVWLRSVKLTTSDISQGRAATHRTHGVLVHWLVETAEVPVVFGRLYVILTKCSQSQQQRWHVEVLSLVQ